MKAAMHRDDAEAALIMTSMISDQQHAEPQHGDDVPDPDQLGGAEAERARPEVADKATANSTDCGSCSPE